MEVKLRKHLCFRQLLTLMDNATVKPRKKPVTLGRAAGDLLLPLALVGGAFVDSLHGVYS
jgi:hypothetical protein